MHPTTKSSVTLKGLSSNSPHKYHFKTFTMGEKKQGRYTQKTTMNAKTIKVVLKAS